MPLRKDREQTLDIGARDIHHRWRLDRPEGLPLLAQLGQRLTPPASSEEVEASWGRAEAQAQADPSRRNAWRTVVAHAERQVELRRQQAQQPSQPPSQSGQQAAAKPPGAPGGSGQAGGPQPAAAVPAFERFANFFIDRSGDAPARVGLTPSELLTNLTSGTGGWPRRVGPRLFAEHRGRLLWLDSVASLFAWIGSLLPHHRPSPLQWASGAPDLVSKEEFVARVRQDATAYEAIEVYPHEPVLPGAYYRYPELPESDGKAVDGLLDFFTPASPVDRELMRAFLLTLVWGGPCGQRPAWLTYGPDNDPQGGRGVGKSTFPQKVASVFGGYIGLNLKETPERLTSRLLTAPPEQNRVAIFDNIKTYKLSNDTLEGLITSPVISGWLPYTGQWQRLNTFSFFFTFNGPQLSKDIAQRAVLIQVARPVYVTGWDRKVDAYIEANRLRIISELVATLRGPGAEIEASGRWGTWEGEVLSRVNDPLACQRLIRLRQDDADVDAIEAEEVREAFMADLLARGKDPDRTRHRYTSEEACEIVQKATLRVWDKRASTTYLNGACIPELVHHRTSAKRGFWWTGKAWSQATAAMDDFDFMAEDDAR